MAAQEDSTLLAMDSVEVSLLTCQPHDEVYSLYGHTAIRYHDMRQKGGVDVAFNYGVFNFHAPYFVARFVFGLTDYELGVYPYHLFQAEYRHFGSMVTEQVLNLTAQEKLQLREALSENLRPENRIYRYNYFYNNCTTKARDIIEQSLDGEIHIDERQDQDYTYRDMVHQKTRRHPWTTFGIDLLLGIKADMKTTQRQREFIPDYLMADYHGAYYVDQRPLVKEYRVAVQPGVQMLEPDFPLSPMQCFIGLLAVGIVLFAVQWQKRCFFVAWEVLLMVAAGTIGIVLFLMLFSQHPTVSLNLQLILLNPLPWFFLWPVVKGKKTIYWRMTAVLGVLFLIGGLFQSYAQGIWCLALCLLLQCCLHLWRKTK